MITQRPTRMFLQWCALVASCASLLAQAPRSAEVAPGPAVRADEFLRRLIREQEEAAPERSFLIRRTPPVDDNCSAADSVPAAPVLTRTAVTGSGLVRPPRLGNLRPNEPPRRLPPVSQAGERTVVAATPVAAAQTESTSPADSAAGGDPPPISSAAPVSIQPPTATRPSASPERLPLSSSESAGTRPLGPPVIDIPTSPLPHKGPLMESPQWAHWQPQLESMVRRGYELASRGASFAARAEFLRSLRTIAQVGDSYKGSRRRSDALARALRAMEEAEDFVPRGATTTIDLAQVISGHRTAVIRPEEAGEMTALIAMQRYFSFAQEQLAESLGDIPLSAEPMFALGRLQMLMDEDSRVAPTLRAARAMVYYQVALIAKPNHARAANELGVLLAKIGRLDEARDVLRRAVAVDPTREMWHNLAVVHQRLGEDQLAQLAEAEAQRSTSSPAIPRGVAKPVVQWVSQEAFRTPRRE